MGEVTRGGHVGGGCRGARGADQRTYSTKLDDADSDLLRDDTQRGRQGAAPC